MTCDYCQHSNIDGEHRCSRCGRRLTGPALRPESSTGNARLTARAAGANALALAPLPEMDARTIARPRSAAPRAASVRAPEISMDAAATLDGLPRPRGQAANQPSLFGAELQPKLIPFESLPRVAAPAAEPAAPSPAPVRPISKATPPGSKPAPRRTAPAEDPQATLDFLPPLKTASRTLKTNAEAVIYCDAAVASPIHRATAAALDLGMIAIAFSSVLVTFQIFGKPAPVDRLPLTLAAFACLFAVVALFYGSLFAIAGSVTPGMRWTHLRLITFDGFPLDGRNRALRFAGAWLSFLSGGIGILWALLDEENLTWHDHISKTFPSLRESESNVVRQGRGKRESR